MDLINDLTNKGLINLEIKKLIMLEVSILI